MKGVIFFLSFHIALLLGGCAVSENSMDDVGQQFQEGIQGRGKIVPNAPLSDSYGPEFR
jgi:hypothetical protein